MRAARDIKAEIAAIDEVIETMKALRAVKWDEYTKMLIRSNYGVRHESQITEPTADDEVLQPTNLPVKW